VHFLGRPCGCGLAHGSVVARTPTPKQDAERQSKMNIIVGRIWDSANPKPSAAHVHYLRSRKLDPFNMPETIRYSEALERLDRGTDLREVMPAMIAKVLEAPKSLTGRPYGVHRTYLQENGKKALGNARMALGPIGGRAVALGLPSNGVIGITEGIETALSVQQNTGLRCWSAISAPNMRSLRLPTDISGVVIFAEPDSTGTEAAMFSAERWSTEGKIVRVATSTDGDANDILMRDGPRAVRALLARAQVYCG
jgi:hypothetical protein